MNRFLPNALIVREILANQDDYGFCWLGLRELAARVGLSVGGVYHRIQDLEGWGWIESHPNSSPPHPRPLRMTPAGMEIAGRCMAYLCAFLPSPHQSKGGGHV